MLFAYERPLCAMSGPSSMGASKTGYSDFRVDPAAFQRLDQRLACFLPAEAGFALQVAQKAPPPISRAVRTFGIAIRFRNFMAATQKQKLFPHFPEAHTAIFAIQQLE
jgi:hypothetical protein